MRETQFRNEEISSPSAFSEDELLLLWTIESLRWQAVIITVRTALC